MTVAQWNEIFHLIEQHGLSLVLLIVLLFWLRPKIDKLWDSATALQKATTKVSNKENIEVIVRLNIEIKGLLREALADTKAGWVQLWQFHNGTHGIGRGKIPFMFLTLTNEYSRPELSEMRMQLRDLPLSMFDLFATQLITGDLVIHTQDMINPDGIKTGMGKMMAQQGAKYSAMRAIRDVDGLIIGFISFVYPDFENFDDPTVQKFLIYSQRMAALLASLDEGEEDGKKSRSETEG